MEVHWRPIKKFEDACARDAGPQILKLRRAVSSFQAPAGHHLPFWHLVVWIAVMLAYGFPVRTIHLPPALKGLRLPPDSP